MSVSVEVELRSEDSVEVLANEVSSLTSLTAEELHPNARTVDTRTVAMVDLVDTTQPVCPHTASN
ncbi:MAG TPA: hypothetical protein DCX77_00970 [Acidimicrobiaceae bacterium]|nr:hypothetical protein [Acidimicrobiaceae bacterium]